MTAQVLIAGLKRRHQVPAHYELSVQQHDGDLDSRRVSRPHTVCYSQFQMEPDVLENRADRG